MSQLILMSSVYYNIEVMITTDLVTYAVLAKLISASRTQVPTLWIRKEPAMYLSCKGVHLTVKHIITEFRTVLMKTLK